MKFFSELGPVSVDCRKNFQTTDGGCEQNTHSKSKYRCAQCVTTHTGQNDHISSREHARLKIARPCVPETAVICVSCLVPLPHLTLTTGTSSLSPTSPIIPDVLSLTNKHCESQTIFSLRWSTAEWRIITNLISHRSACDAGSGTFFFCELRGAMACIDEFRRSLVQTRVPHSNTQKTPSSTCRHCQ